MKTVKVNALGKPCPLPVIAAKKAIQELPAEGGQVDVLVDNEVAVKNVTKMAAGNGYQVKNEADGDNQLLHIAVTEKSAQTQKETGSVIVFGHNVMGGGDDELGKILMKSYIYSLTELTTPPEQLLFFNGGAFLTTEGSDVLDDLKTLEDKGAQISTCGTCVDFYDMKDKVAIGDITNMYAIAEVMSQSDRTIVL